MARCPPDNHGERTSPVENPTDSEMEKDSRPGSLRSAGPAAILPRKNDGQGLGSQGGHTSHRFASGTHRQGPGWSKSDDTLLRQKLEYKAALSYSREAGKLQLMRSRLSDLTACHQPPPRSRV